MTLNALVNPFQPLVGLTGVGLTDGDLYVGVAGMDPETNPQTCYWDDAGLVVAAQPIEVLGGYPARLGTPARVYTADTYSIRLRDRAGVQVFYESNAGPFIPTPVPPLDPDIELARLGVFPTLAAAQAAVISADVRVNGVELRGYYDDGDRGGALYRYVAVPPAHAGKFQSADGAWWEIVPGQEGVNVRTLGAKGDDVADDTTAFANAGAVAVALRTPRYAPQGTYKITAPLDLGQSGADGVLANKLVGEGQDLTIIKQYTNNTPILKWGGAFGYLADLSLTYASRQTTADPDAIGVEFYALRWSVFERVKISNAYRNYAIKQAAVYLGANWVSNVTGRNLYNGDFTGAAFHMVSFAGGSGGFRLENVHCVSRDALGADQNVETPYYFAAFSEIVLDNVHIESCKPDEALYVSSVDNLIINGLHLESLAPRLDYGGLLHASAGNLSIIGLTIYNCSFLVANGLASAYHLFRLEAASYATIDGVDEAASTITTPLTRQFTVSGGANRIYTRKFRLANFADQGVFPTPYEYRMKDDLVRPLTVTVGADRGDASVTVGAGADAETQIFNTPLTANRSVTLSLANVWDGARFRVVRRPGAGGAFGIDVGPGLKTLAAAATWCEVEYGPTTGWVLTGYGAL